MLFKIELTPTQEEIVRDIIERKIPRMTISAMTRYGKSQGIAVAVGIYLLLNAGRRVFFIAPTRDKAMILRNYLNELVVSCPLLLSASDLEIFTSEDRLKKEVSKGRVTFKNGCEYRVFTAHNDGSGLMGSGLGKEGGLLIIDEAAEITFEAYAKITRMLGDNPENSQIVELYNPWHRDCKAYEHSIDEDWKHYHIDWRVAIEEGRTTEDFVERQRKELNTLAFTVLYESRFPEESEDSLFNYTKIMRATENEFELGENLKHIVSCDPADKGLDLTVIMYGILDVDSGKYILKDIYSEDVSENMEIAGRIVQWAEKYEANKIHIDPIGIGAGVVSRVREVLGNKAQVIACHFGEGVGSRGKHTKPHKYERIMERDPLSAKNMHSNRKAEQYFRLKDLFDENLIQMPRKNELITELMNMKKGLTSSGKNKIIDPERSPNFADALVYLIWRTDDEVIFDFGNQTKTDIYKVATGEVFRP